MGKEDLAAQSRLRAAERVIEQAQAVNQHWSEVTVWCDGETRVQRIIPRLYRYEFIGEDPGTQRAVFAGSK